MSLEKNSYYSLSPQQNFIHFNSLKNDNLLNRIVLEIKNSNINNFILSLTSIMKDEIMLKLEVSMLDQENSVCIRLDEKIRLLIKQETDESVKNKENQKDLLSEDVNLKVAILKIDENVSELILESPAFYSDLWSLLLIADKSMHYANNNVEEQLSINYLQFAEWKNQLLLSDDGAESKNYWSDKIKNSKRLKVNFESFNKNTGVSQVSKIINKELISKLDTSHLDRELCFLSAWYYTLSRLSSEKEEHSTLGYIHNGRSFEQLYGNLGAFSFNIPFRLHSTEDSLLISEYLKNVEKELKSINTHKEYLSIDKDYYEYASDFLSYQFEYIDHKLFCKSGELKLAAVSIYDQPLKLRLQIHNSDDTIKIVLFFDENKFQSEEVKYILDLWESYCIQITDNLNQGQINDITYYQHEEIPGNIIDNQESILDLFDYQVKNHGDECAIVADSNSLTYNELDARSTLLAIYLSEKGVGDNSKIGVLCDPNHNLMISMLSILKLGAAFIPIDPNDNSSRINHIVSDAGIKHVLSVEKFSYVFESIENSNPIFLDTIDTNELGKYDYNLPKRSSEDIGYIIYTSGTTGKSKGVCIKDSSLVNYVKWLCAYLGINETDASILLSSYAFDLGYTAIWGTILTGGTLHFVDRELIYQTDSIINYIAANGITYIKTTPSYFNVLNNSYNVSKIEGSKLRLVLLGGEKINTKDIISFNANNSGIQFINHYGPTETTIGCIAHKIDTKNIAQYKARPVIGKPITNNLCLILDKKGREVEFGVIGELHIGGSGLAHGYLNKLDLTSTKFVEYHTHGRIYATGDLGIKFLNGDILFLGRNDNQIKIRGYRVELDEIKDVLESIQEIDQAVVVTSNVNKDVEIIAYVISKDSIDEIFIKESLNNYLPDYMIPSTVIQLDKIPITANNKIDYKNLPLKAAKENKQYDCNPTEEKIISFWKEILQTEEINLHDNFFALGGHSLKGIQFLNRVHKEFNIRLSLKEIYEFPTPKEFSSLLNIENESFFDEIELIAIQENYAVSNAQKRFWLASQRRETKNLYNVPLRFKINGNVNVDALAKSFLKMIERHETLRTLFKFKNGELRQYVLPVEQLNFSIGLLKNVENIDSVILDENSTSFNLENEIAIRVKLIEINAHEHILLLTLHHIISDEWSRTIINREIPVFYNSIIKNEKINLPLLKVQYKDFVYWHEKNCKKQEQFWQNFFVSKIEPLNFPLDFPRLKKMTYDGNSVQTIISGKKISNLKKNLELYNINVNDYFIGIYGLLIHLYAKQDEFIIGTIVSGRNHVDLEQLIGVFINYLPLKINVNKNYTLKQYLAELHKDVLQVYENQEYPFDLMIEKFNEQTDYSRNSIFDTMIVFHNEEDQDLKVMLSDNTEITKYIDTTERDSSKLDFKLDVTIGKEEITIQLEYNSNLFRSDSMENVLNNFESMIVNSVADLNNPIKNLEKKQLVNTQQSIQILSSFVSNPLNDHLDFWFKEFRINHNISFFDYNQVLQGLNEIHHSSGNNDLVVVFNRFEDYIDQNNTNSLPLVYNKLEESLIKIAKERTILLFILPIAHDQYNEDANEQIIIYYNKLANISKGIENVTLINLLNFSEIFPWVPIFDYYRNKNANIPYKEEFYYSISSYITRVILNKSTILSKVIALDCDNTLWAGVCGEDSIEDIKITAGHQYLQEFIIKKHEEGFLIVLLSKNNEEDVWNIFQNHPDMLLKQTHIISSRINWNEKHLNIKEIATELNLSLNNFIFIDDNVMECHNMIVGNPEVLTLQLPENDLHIAGFLNSIISLDKFDITSEDKLRNEMYLSEKERNKYVEESKDQNIDFLSKLNLQLYFNEIDNNSLKRMVQLSKRTNQFNMNGVILEDSDLHNMTARGYKGYSVTLKDLFGDYGIVGCVILKEDQGDLTITNFFLSCRVLGKGVEYEILSIIKDLYFEKSKNVKFLFKETGKNTAFKKFLDTLNLLENYNFNMELQHWERKNTAINVSVNQPYESPAALLNNDLKVEDYNVKKSETLNEDVIGWIWDDNVIRNHNSDQHSNIYKILRLLDYTKFNKSTLISVGSANSIETILWNIFSEVLNTNKIGLDDDFFDLGGNSLKATHVLSRMYYNHKLEVSLNDFFDNSSIEKLSGFIVNNGSGAINEENESNEIQEMIL